MSPAGQLALYCLLLAGFFLTALWRPSVSVAAVLCIYGLKQWGQATSAWLAAHGLFTNFAIGAVVLTALAIRMLRGKCVFCNVRQGTWAVIALYAYAFFSLLWTPRPDLALNMWAVAYPYVTAAVLLAPLAIQDSDDLYQSYFALLIMGGVLVFALLLFAKWGDRGVLISGGAAELETNPLAIANLGGAVASAALFLRTRSLPVLSWIVRLVVVAAALALIVKSGSRGQLVATLATLILMMPVAFQISHVRGLVPMFIAMAVIFCAAEYSAENFIRRDDDRWSQTDATGAASERWRMNQAVLEHWAQSPGSVLFGLGNSAAYDPNILGGYPHDVPLETLGEEGVVGFIIYLSINGLALRGLLRGMRLTKDDTGSRRLLAVAGANFVFSLITTLKEGNMVGSAEFFMAAIILARMPELLTAAAQPARAAGNEAVPARTVFANIMR
jgi:hypothetical protein